MLSGLSRNYVEDDKLWEMIRRVNQVAHGDYENYDNNASVLMPLMDRILVCSKEVKDWDVYFYAMAKFLWLVKREAINDIRRAFWISEMFHQDMAMHVGENIGRFAGEFRVDIASEILGFYLDYPQADDAKIQRMLEIFLECRQKYGNSWNNSNYNTVMLLACLNRDKELAETARKMISKGDFERWCYTCFLGKPMLNYYILHDDAEGIEELIARISSRAIPVKYQWCFERCQNSGEKNMVDLMLEHCLHFGNSTLFAQVFERWKALYQEPAEHEVEATHEVLFRSLAGDWTREEERLRLAEKDDENARKKKDAPRCCLYWALCWHCYFQMLDKKGQKKVRLRLGWEEKADKETGMQKEGIREWNCLEAAKYFEA